MKRRLAWILTILMALSATFALAEAPVAESPAVAPNYEELTVGSTTAMSGNFFNDMWGSNTADMDVRTLLHGYKLIQWQGEEGTYGIDESVEIGRAHV